MLAGVCSVLLAAALRELSPVWVQPQSTLSTYSVQEYASLSPSLLLSPSLSPSLPPSLQSYSHNFLVAHGAHITEGEEEASLTAMPSVSSGPKMSTPRALLGSREDVYESDAVKEGEWEGD